MPNDSWQKGPLGEELEKYVGHRTEGTGWGRGMSNWDNLRAEVCIQSSTFVTNLSASQRGSLKLLLEWWGADCQERSIMLQTSKVLYQHANSGLSDNRKTDALDFNISLYHKKMFDLFLYEFYFYEQETVAPIQLQRHDASLIAPCQRLAFSVLTIRYSSALNSTSDNSHSSAKPLKNTHDEKDWHQPIGAFIEACP